MYQPLIKFHPYPAIITQVLRIFAKMRESRPCVSFVLFCKIPLNRRPGAYEDPIECNLFDFNRNDDDFLP